MAWRVRVELGRRRLVLFDGERPIASFVAGIGKPASPTPTGRWEVVRKGREADGDIEVAVLDLSTPQRRCLRGTPALDSLGLALSGG